MPLQCADARTMRRDHRSARDDVCSFSQVPDETGSRSGFLATILTRKAPILSPTASQCAWASLNSSSVDSSLSRSGVSSPNKLKSAVFLGQRSVCRQGSARSRSEAGVFISARSFAIRSTRNSIPKNARWKARKCTRLAPGAHVPCVASRTCLHQTCTGDASDMHRSVQAALCQRIPCSIWSMQGKPTQGGSWR